MRRLACLGTVLAAVVIGLAGGCRTREYDAPAGNQGRVSSGPAAYSAVPESPDRVGDRAGGVAVGGGGVVGGAVSGAAVGVVGGMPSGTGGQPAPNNAAAPPDRKLIKDVYASLEVPSLERALARLRGAAEGAGGYAASESRTRDERGVNRGNLVLRVNAGRLDALVSALSSLGKVEHMRTTAGDITEEYFDLELRIANQRRLQARLLELLNRPGNKLSELIEAERELARVSGEIEQMEGRRRFWDSRVALATLAIDLHEPLPAVAGGEGGPLAALKRSFSNAADNFVYAVAGIIAFTGGLIPIAVAILLAAWVVVRLWRLRKRLRARRA